MKVGGEGELDLHVAVPVPVPYSIRCVHNDSVIFSLEILNLYWDSVLFRGGPNFSLRVNWKRIVDAIF